MCSGGPYFQFGLSNNYGANFYTWEFEKMHKHFSKLDIWAANTDLEWLFGTIYRLYRISYDIAYKIYMI